MKWPACWARRSDESGDPASPAFAAASTCSAPGICELTAPSRIAAVFESLRSQGRMAFMPFVTAGDPDVSTTVELIRLLRDCGVDLIEVGFPYSDPIADGPVIQASYTRALANKVRLPDIFGGLKALAGEPIPPLLAMVAYAIVFRAGPERFVRAAPRRPAFRD